MNEGDEMSDDDAKDKGLPDEERRTGCADGDGTPDSLEAGFATNGSDPNSDRGTKMPCMKTRKRTRKRTGS
jgi:hypothetical protein